MRAERYDGMSSGEVLCVRQGVFRVDEMMNGCSALFAVAAMYESVGLLKHRSRRLKWTIVVHERIQTVVRVHVMSKNGGFRTHRIS